MQRRRFIQLLATSLTGLSVSHLAEAHSNLKPVKWNGYTLGAEGRFTLFTEDRHAAQNDLAHCFAEIRRLEKLFSLYDSNSEISRLNATGSLVSPSKEWLAILEACDHANQLSNGGFDPTIQPLWDAYANPQNNTPQAIDLARSAIGWKHVSYSRKQITFNRANMKLTLNGIAQGFITDHITQLLKNAGYEHVLVELGETRALGTHPEHRPWNLGIKDAQNPDALFDVVELNDQALATSGSYGTPLSIDGKMHHLINPQTGKSDETWKSVSVIAPTAVQADALSTGLSFSDPALIQTIQHTHPEIQIITQS